jgi:hypothetical protein
MAREKTKAEFRPLLRMNLFFPNTQATPFMAIRAKVGVGTTRIHSIFVYHPRVEVN